MVIEVLASNKTQRSLKVDIEVDKGTEKCGREEEEWGKLFLNWEDGLNAAGPVPLQPESAKLGLSQVSGKIGIKHSTVQGAAIAAHHLEQEFQGLAKTSVRGRAVCMVGGWSGMPDRDERLRVRKKGDKVEALFCGQRVFQR